MYDEVTLQILETYIVSILLSILATVTFALLWQQSRTERHSTRYNGQYRVERPHMPISVQELLARPTVPEPEVEVDVYDRLAEYLIRKFS